MYTWRSRRVKTFKQAIENILAGRTTASEEEIDGMVQNYPNPFNPITTIRFRLNRDDNIEINVYDITGKKIRTLANGFYKAGVYDVEFDGSDLSSGIYLYEFRTSKKISVKKMLLLK